MACNADGAANITALFVLFQNVPFNICTSQTPTNCISRILSKSYYNKSIKIYCSSCWCTDDVIKKISFQNSCTTHVFTGRKCRHSWGWVLFFFFFFHASVVLLQTHRDRMGLPLELSDTALIMGQRSCYARNSLLLTGLNVLTLDSSTLKFNS